MNRRLSRSKLTIVPCLALLVGSVTSQAASDVCAKLTPELLATTLGDQFSAPVQTSAPAEEFKGDYVSCLYTANALTFEIRRWGQPNAALRVRDLQAAQARYASNARAR